MSALSPEQIDRIVAGTEKAPPSHAHLTMARAIEFFQRSATQAVSMIGEHEVAEVDREVYDKKGAVVLDTDGLPKIERVRVSKRSVAARPFLLELKRHQGLYRARLQLSNEQHAEIEQDVRNATEREFGDREAQQGQHKAINQFQDATRARLTAAAIARAGRAA